MIIIIIQLAQSLSGRNFIVWNRWKSTLKARSKSLLYSRGNTRISRTEFVYDKLARDGKC